MTNRTRLPLIIMMLGLIMMLPGLCAIAARSRTTTDQLSVDFDELEARLDDLETRSERKGEITEIVRPELIELKSRVDELRRTEWQLTFTDVGVIAGTLTICIGNVVYLFRRSKRTCRCGGLDDAPEPSSEP